MLTTVQSSLTRVIKWVMLSFTRVSEGSFGSASVEKGCVCVCVCVCFEDGKKCDPFPTLSTEPAHSRVYGGFYVNDNNDILITLRYSCFP